MSIYKKVKSYYKNKREVYDYLKCEINCDTEVIKYLENLLSNKGCSEKSTNFIKKGLNLHQKRLQAIKAYKRELSKGSIFCNKNRLKKLSQILYSIKLQLEQHENHKYNQDWRKDYYGANA